MHDTDHASDDAFARHPLAGAAPATTPSRPGTATRALTAARLLAALALAIGALVLAGTASADTVSAGTVSAGTVADDSLAGDTDAGGAAARPVPAAVPAADPGTGTLRLGAPGTAIDALHLDTTLELDVRGLLAELTLTQVFRNHGGERLDGRYVFPLPADAAVRGLEVRTGGRVVSGQVAERREARERFERARATGQVAGLVEQQRPNLFTTRVAGIAAGAEVSVRLDVLLPIRARGERLSLTLPTTLTPRYANGRADEGGGTPSLHEGPILPAGAHRGPRLSLEARIAPLADLSLATGETHRLTVAGDRLVLRDVPMDRDVVLSWPFADAAAPSATAFAATHAGERYVQAFMAPPAPGPDAAGRSIPRELVLVLDTSGSMAGLPIEAAREAALAALDGLAPADTVDLIAFDDRTRALFDAPRVANAANLDAARRFVRGLRADGGTEMEPALERALTSTEDPEAAPSRLRQVVFLTDGSIAREGRLLALIRRELGGARLFTVGIGSAPNGWFLDKAAEAGRGTALSIRDMDDVQDAVTDLLGRLERPVLTDIVVQFPGGRGEVHPARVPDLYADSPLMLVARLEGEPREMLISGWRGEERFRRRVALPAAAADEARVAPALAMHWARERVDSLLDEQRESSDPERHRAAITELALEVGLISPYTSLIAVESRAPRADEASGSDQPGRAMAARPATRTAQVANLLPSGSTMEVIDMPRGAAGIDSLALLAGLFTLLGGGCFALARLADESDR